MLLGVTVIAASSGFLSSITCLCTTTGGGGGNWAGAGLGGGRSGGVGAGTGLLPVPLFSEGRLGGSAPGNSCFLDPGVAPNITELASDPCC